MDYMIVCANPSCRKASLASDKQKTLIERSKANGQTFVVLQCSHCASPINYDPQDPKGEVSPKKRELLIPCPCKTCDSFVCYVSWPGQESFWGCGGCGEQWTSRESIDDAITASVEQFPYRRRCYTKGPTHWEPVQLNDRDRAEYKELVRKEWDL